MSLPRDAYQEYTALAPIWQEAFGTDQTLLALLKGSSERDLDPALKQRLGNSALSKAVDLRVVIEQIRTQRQGRWDNPMYLDVYDLALYMQLYLKSLHDPGSWYYRGQCLGWPTMPSIFRPPKGAQTLTEDELNHREALIATFLEAFERAYPGKYTRDQRVAIAQHYGERNQHHMGLNTWLLDLSTDPCVALFFASLRGEEHDIGTVTVFARHEWQFLSAGGSNLFGSMRTIEVPGALRIERQKARFLDTPHPSLIEQSALQQYSFYQQPGLLFEDPARGITKDLLLPSEDALLQWVQHWEPQDTMLQHQGLDVLQRSAQPLTAADYMEIVESWIAHSDNSKLVLAAQSPVVKHRLKCLCEFHTNLQKAPEHIPLQARYIFPLKHAVEDILAKASLEEAVQFNYEWRTDHPDVLRRILAEVER